MCLLFLQLLLISYCSATININEPLAVTITPKIWNLLETKAHIINAAVSSITFPELEGKEHLVKYRVWDGRVEQFSVPANGVSFQDVNNGVYLSVKGVQFQARIHGRVEIGKKVFGKWVRIARMSGDITAKSEHANLDVNLAWDDFKFIPTVTMDSNVRVDFTHHLRRLNFLRSKVEKAVNSKVDSEVPNKLIHAIEDKANPRLQKLKQKLIDMGINNHELDWRIMNGTLRITLKPKGTGEITSISPIDKMICIDASILDALEILNRSKRGLRSKLKGLTDKILGRHHQSESDSDPNPPAPPAPPSPPIKNLDFTCVEPTFTCGFLSCTYCTDVDVNPSSSTSTNDTFQNCYPQF
ncbi:unnamed protein product [Cylicocyclus nassatus]|uniref:Uncharacterized protein n=1 Tax=Cylicocyclus nassatus TaxID=53992 RepID=A0AA36DMK5_CYLNA|nr:unnamed protein product [Cylicocyclus nassatus]